MTISKPGSNGSPKPKSPTSVEEIEQFDLVRTVRLNRVVGSRPIGSFGPNSSSWSEQFDLTRVVQSIEYSTRVRKNSSILFKHVESSIRASLLEKANTEGFTRNQEAIKNARSDLNDLSRNLAVADNCEAGRSAENGFQSSFCSIVFSLKKEPNTLSLISQALIFI